MVSEKEVLTFSVIIIVLCLDLTEALGRYVIEQRHKSNNLTKSLGDIKQDENQVQNENKSTGSEEYRHRSSVSGHRVPVTGPRQLQKQQFDSTNVRIETVLVMSVLGGALVCLILVQVWRQVAAFKKRRLRKHNNQIIESIKNQSDTPWNRDQIQFVSAEVMGDVSSDLQDCDCQIKTNVHRQGYEKVACHTTAISEDTSAEDILFDSFMVPANCSHHRPEVVHVNMNIVQVVHHCGEPDPSKCVQDGCGKVSHNKKQNGSVKKGGNLDTNFLSSVIPLHYKEGYNNAVIDMDDMKNINGILEDKQEGSKLNFNRISPSNTSRKSYSGKSLISNCESSDSDRYDTVVNLQSLKHSDTAALLIKDGKAK